MRKRAIAFDVQAVCAGFVYALDIAEAMIQSGEGVVLWLLVESFSKLLDWKTDHCVLFGDGAGMVLELSKILRLGILSFVLHSDGAIVTFCMWMVPSSNALVGHVRMEGKEVFRHAVEKLAAVMTKPLMPPKWTPRKLTACPASGNIWIIGWQKNGNGVMDRVLSCQ